MCGISGFEFVVIVVAAIIILGPDKLPDMLRLAGKATRELRKWKGDLGDMTREIQRSIPVDDLRKNLSEDLQLDRARTRIKETESEIDALRARLKQRVEAEERETVAAVTPQPRPMNTAARGVRRPERVPNSPEPDALTADAADAAPPTEPARPGEPSQSGDPAPALPTLRPANGTASHAAPPRAASTTVDARHHEEPAAQEDDA
jgi:sec-independent protein translocase protein TatB